MARFNASSALLRNGTISGLANAVAQPDYLKRVAAEPMMRRLVPFMMVIFLAAAWTGAIVQLVNDRTEAVMAAKVDLENIASLGSIDLQIELAQMELKSSPADQNLTQNLIAAVGLNSLENGRHFLMSDTNGLVIASTHTQYRGTNFKQLFAPNHDKNLLASAERAGVQQLQSANGDAILATVRSLGTGKGHLTVIQPLSQALNSWKARAISMGILAFASTIIITALGLAFYHQNARAAEADSICEEVRRRIDVVLSSGGSGLWDWDIPRGRIFWSDSLYELLGRTRKQDFLSFADIGNFIHPDDTNPFMAMGKSLDSSQDSSGLKHIEHEFRALHANGSWRWIRIRGQLISEIDAPHLVGIAVDITAEKAADLKRFEDDIRLRDAIETVSEAFALFDPAKKLIIANSRFENLYQIPHELMQKGADQDLIRAAAVQKQMQQETTLNSCEETGDRSFECQTEDGRWYHVNERRTKDGGHVSVSSDITTHKVYEESLAANNIVLEQMVADLKASSLALQLQTHELEELSASHLEQKASAISANRAKAEFLANMNHELRTPLNAIINFAEVMETGLYGNLNNPRYEEYSQHIGKSGRYLLGVISDILDMASLEADRIKLDREDVSLSAVIDCVISNVADVADSKNISLEIKKTGPLNIVGDRKALNQIVSNLLNNAIKFTSEGGKAGIRAMQVGESVHLFFEDNGSGIHEDDIGKVARPFEQSGAIIEDGYKGSGLGLSIARALIELQGGTIRLRSKVGVGTIVMVKLPIRGSRSMFKKAG